MDLIRAHRRIKHLVGSQGMAIPEVGGERIWSWISWILLLGVALGLRVWGLQENPNGLWTDEAANGYFSYCLLETGRGPSGELLPLLFSAFRKQFIQRLPQSEPDSTASPATPQGTATLTVQAIQALLADMETPSGLEALRTQLSEVPTAITEAALLAAIRWYRRYHTSQPAVPRGGILYDQQQLAEYAALFEEMDDEFVS